MLQTVLIFTFGFLAAALLALMAAPAVWRRAVYLTRKRIEAALPLSLNELNAEKDALRAEHAMAMRRMELRLKDTREHDTSEKVLVEEQGERIKSLESNVATTAARNAELERQHAEITGKLHERITELSEMSVLLESTRTELDIRSSELKAATRLREDRASQLKEVSAQLQSVRDELGDRERQIETLCETIAEMKSVGHNLKREVHESNIDGQAIGDLLTSERKRMAQTEAKLEQALSQAQMLSEKLKRRDAEIRDLREQDGAAAADIREMESRVEAAEAQKAKLERKIDELSAQIEGMSGAFGGKDAEAMIEDMKAKLAQQSTEIKSLQAERDGLRVELAAASFGAAAESDEGDAILRDKLNQLAAEVVAMAARLEGPESRINTLLGDAKPTSTGEVVSLAERIKALQRDAGRQRTSA